MQMYDAREIKNFIVACITSGQIPFTYGEPGIGKSEIHEQVAEDYNLKLVDIRLSRMLPEDLNGFAHIIETNGVTKATYIPFDTFPLEGDKLPRDENGNEMEGWLVLLDELPDASDEVLAACYKLLLGREVAGRKLHGNAVLAAAGNPASSSSIARKLPDTVLTRVVPAQMRANPKAWLQWAKKFKGKNQAVVDFIDKDNSQLVGDPGATREENEVYPNPRGWGAMFKLMNTHEENNQIPVKDNAGIVVEGQTEVGKITKGTKIAAYGLVGHFAANAFFEEYSLATQVPLAWDVAQAPSSAPIPTGASMINMLDSLVNYFLGCTEASRDNILKYLNRIPDENKKMFVMKLKDDLGKAKSDIDLLDSIQKRLNVV